MQSDNEIWSVNTIYHEKHLIEYNLKYGRKTTPRPFFKKSKLIIFLDH